MKILNDIACRLNWIGFKFNSIEFKYIVEWNSNTTKFNSNWNELRFGEKKHGMQIGGENIEILFVNMVLNLKKK
jgi:hypothetical protein